jgi:hypothetical protein
VTTRGEDFGISHPRTWAGLTRQGMIMISIDRLRGGALLDDVVAHESVHNVLLKVTQAGLVQMALDFAGTDPWPEGALRRRCAALLGLSLDATRYTHEGCATFVPGVGRTGAELARYTAQHPADYLAAANSLEWLRGRAVDDDLKRGCAFALAVAALSVPVLDRWREAQLDDLDAAARFWSDPTLRPDRRFPVFCEHLRAISANDVEALVAGGVEQLRGVRLGGREMPVAPLDPDTWTGSGLLTVFRSIFGRLLDEVPLSADERDSLESAMNAPWLALNAGGSPEMAVLLKNTRPVTGGMAVDPPLEALDGYPLVRVLHNTGAGALPGLEPIGDRPWLLGPGDAALWLTAPARPPRACQLSSGVFRAYLARLPEDTTLAVQDGTYYFGAGTGEPLLLTRRHVVWVENRTPRAIADTVAAAGLDAKRGPVLITNAISDIPGVSYLLLRPASRPFPLVIVPTSSAAAMLTKDYLIADPGPVRFRFLTSPEEFFGASGRRVLVDFGRVVHDFEGRPWGDELMPWNQPGERTWGRLLTTAVDGLRRFGRSD